jgi:signal-transduction protein with cAMP-binding, CBS, and nucleotidyltransferase domain
MGVSIRQPNEILAYRPLKLILGAKSQALWSVGSQDNVATAVRLMGEKDIGCVVVADGGKLVGIVSERDCVRRVVLTGKSAETTSISEIMVRDVITADLSQTFAECLNLMHRHRIRHLPIVDAGKPITVISIRDLLSEAVSHHAKVIAELERERLTIFTSTA